MAIQDLNEVELREILNAHLTPSKEIVTPERLLGREKYLRQIERAFNSEGRSVFIYGDRGVGKTSVAVTAAALNNFADEGCIYVPCGAGSTFGEIIQMIGKHVTPVQNRIRPKRVVGGVNLGYLGTSVGANINLDGDFAVPKPQTALEALDVLTYVANSRQGRTIVVIDEFDRITSDHDKVLFSELIKNLPTANVDLRLIMCGIGQTVDDILGAHFSSGRYFEPIELEKLHHNHLWNIIQIVADKTNIEIPRDTLMRIGIVSDGFPHFVHLIGECIFWAIHDDPRIVTRCARCHYDDGAKAALARTEPALKLAYRRATEKTKNQLEYEEALWALADRSETRRQITRIYETSYKRIARDRVSGDRKPLTKEALNSRLLSLKKESHGSVVVGHGSGWFSFRENVLRGYVRLKAETEGVELTPDPV